MLTSLWLLKGFAVLLLFGVGLIGGFLPLRMREKEFSPLWFALANAFAGGVFLAVGLIHMLGDASSDFSAAFPGFAYPVVFLLAGCTFLLLLLVGKVLADEENVTLREKIDSRTLLISLSIHSVLAGLALGIESTMSDAAVVLIALLAHKGIAAFALGNSFAASALGRGHIRFSLVLFACMTPLGVALGAVTNQAAGSSSIPILEPIFNALAAGTFLYIASLDILGREFSARLQSAAKFAAVLIGFGLMALVAIWT